MSIINYSEQSRWENSMLAIAKGNHFIEIEKLDEPYRRADGKRVSHQMRYCELSVEAEAPDDEAWACVRFDEYTYWSASELYEIGIKVNAGRAKYDPENVFDLITIM